MKNQDIDFFPDDIFGKRAERRHLGLPLSVCHQGLFCIILGVTQDQRNAANCMLRFNQLICACVASVDVFDCIVKKHTQRQKLCHVPIYLFVCR